uniref:Neutral ceramidase n=1 Tax=Sinocyclocheilus grahami TaxID=75366 RepID=A0A672R5G7_SINGR
CAEDPGKLEHRKSWQRDNVVPSGPHTHSGVGGYFQYTLFMITSKGYIKPSIQAIVSGIVKSIDIAHRNLRPGRIFINKGQLEERNRYEFNTDKQIVIMKFTDLDGDGMGLLSWFAVHPVSMNDTNRMVSSDNLGYASFAFEQEKNKSYASRSVYLQGPFVAGFSSSNLGDSSLNIRGPVCVNTGKKYDYLNSSCPIGGVSYLSTVLWDTDGDPFWDEIRDAVLGPPSNKTTACHQPKPILFSTGEMDSPLPWHPAIVDVQIITIGSLAIVAELEVKESFANAEVVVAGLCNIYTHYITTYEEYQVYTACLSFSEPSTLTKTYRNIVMETIGELPKGPEPPFFDEDKLFNQVQDPVADVAPADTTFGDVLQQVNPIYKVGEIASVTFVAGNPRHSGNIRDKTFVTVERFHNDTNSWEIIHTDASWETRFHWIKGLAGRSQSKVEWHIPLTAQTGTYRIQHFGHYKQFTDNNTITPYVGTSDAFKVTRSFYYY